MLSAMAMWWSSAADFVTLSCSALPLPMASCVLRPATMPSPRTTQPMRSRTRAEQTIAIVPMATRGSNTTGMCTKSGWAGRPANFEMRTGQTSRAEGWTSEAGGADDVMFLSDGHCFDTGSCRQPVHGVIAEDDGGSGVGVGAAKVAADDGDRQQPDGRASLGRGSMMWSPRS